VPRSGDGSNTGGDAEDGIDNQLGNAKTVVDDAGHGADELGEAVQDGKQAGKDARDGDQDTADKASNVGHGGADGLRDVGEALRDWGIGDPGLGNLTNDLDDLTEDIFGKKHAPDSLPPVRYRLFFGKKDTLTNIAENAFGDALGVADGLLESAANEIGASDYLGTDPFSSVMEKHSPFAEDPTELDRAESTWSVVRVRAEEGLNQVWRCEMLVVADEVRDTALEGLLDAQTTSSGGLIDQIAGPIKSAVGTIHRLADIEGGADGVDNDPNAVDYEAMKAAEADLEAKEADLAEKREYAAMLRELLADRQAATPPAGAAEVAQLNTQIAAADQAVQRSLVIRNAAQQKLDRERVKARKAESNTTAVAKRIDGIKGATDNLAAAIKGNPGASSVEDAIGALAEEVMSGGEEGRPDGTVYVNVPLDPADFLGQTCSLRVSREFMSPAPVSRPFDVPGHSFTARYLTGVVVEMEDLGTRVPPGGMDSAPGVSAGSRWLRIVLQPELAKLSLRKDHRVFNEMTPLEIIREVFRSAGVYGFLPDIPGVGFATNMISEGLSHIPFVGNAMGDALTGQFILMMPPASSDISVGGATMGAHEWTQTREMCVQYGETDLDFVRRLLEEEGIHFTFTCRRGFERIVFLDDPVALDEAPTVDGRPVTLNWPHWKGSPNVETISAGGERRRVRASTVTMRDFTFSNPTLQTDELVFPPTDAQTPPPPEAIRPSYATRFEYPGAFPYQYAEAEEKIHYRSYGGDEGDRDYARLRLGEELTRNRRVTLQTDLVGASCDMKLRIRGFPFQRDGIPLDQSKSSPPADPLVIESIRWEGAGQGGSPKSGPNWNLRTPRGDYLNRVTGWWIGLKSPNRLPIRPPRRTPKPRITSVQTATVVDWEGDHDEDEEIEHDHATLTRVRVRFHWDRRGELPLGIMLPAVKRGRTCFCRVARTWAGDDYGVSFVPRIGTEVVVAFENGDPDRPVIIGSLYDAEHPVPLPGREAKRDDFTPPKAAPVQMSTIATRTSPWDADEGVASELTFDDTIGHERVFLKAGRHLIEEVRTDHHTRVEKEQRADVGRHHGEIIEKQQTMTVGKNRDKTVAGNQSVTIEGNRERTVRGNQTVHVTLDHDEEVSGVSEERVVGDRALHIRGARVTEVGQAGDLEAHDRHEVVGAKDDAIEGVLKVRAGALATGMAGSGPDAPGASIQVGPDGVVAKADAELKLVAEGEVRIVSEEAAVEFTVSGIFDVLSETDTVNVGSAEAEQGILFKSFNRVQTHTKNTVMVITDDEVWLRTVGEAEATAEVSASQVRLFGKTAIIKAKVAIESAGPTKVGP